MRISDWSSDVCSSDLELLRGQNGVDRAIGLLEKSADRGGTSVGNFATAVEQATRRIEAAASGGPEKLVGAPTAGPSSSTNLLANTIKNASAKGTNRSEEHTSELQSLMRLSYAVFCLKKKIKKRNNQNIDTNRRL